MAACERWLRARCIRQIRAACHAEVSGSASSTDAAGTSCSAECTTPSGFGTLVSSLRGTREVPLGEQRQKLRGDPPAEMNH
jgi:hypothetical protein